MNDSVPKDPIDSKKVVIPYNFQSQILGSRIIPCAGSERYNTVRSLDKVTSNLWVTPQ